MSIEQNKTVVRGFIEQVWNGHRPDLLDQYMVKDVVYHDAPGLDSLENVRNFIAANLNSFPDLKVSIDIELAEGDLVVQHQTIRGTHKGELMGIPASGKPVEFPGIYTFRVSAGKITEFWGISDVMALMQQIGAIPTPAAAPLS